MPVTHEPWLVALSLVVAIQGAYVGLSLAGQVGGASGLRRRLLLAAAALSLAVAIWSMHFVAMLAARLPLPVDYLALPTLLSFLVCVIVVGAGVFAASAGPLGTLRFSGAAVALGSGIASMHYIGMTALHASAHLVHATPYVVGSVAIAIAASGLALWLAEGRGGRPPLVLSAIAFGMAIAGMHYTAMAGLTVFPHSSPASGAPALSPDLLAIVVAVVAFLMSGVFLLTLVPERSVASSIAENETDTSPDRRPSAQQAAASPSIQSAQGSITSVDADFGQGTYSPLGGAGGPPRRIARHLPVERDGATLYVSVDDIVAVHANAHYSYVFDGAARLFCSLSIGDIESRLDESRFVRVHRSHIVNIERIVGLKRAGDNGVIELAATDHYTVPVSRARFGWLKSRLRPRADEAVA
jgi:NO-binding membrane sensor protein with MHYT domain